MHDTWHVWVICSPHTPLHLVFHELLMEACESEAFLATLRHIQSCMEACCCGSWKNIFRESLKKRQTSMILSVSLDLSFTDALGMVIELVLLCHTLSKSIKVWCVDLPCNPHFVPFVSCHCPFIPFSFVSYCISFLAIASSAELYPSSARRAPSFYLRDKGVSSIMQVKSWNWNQLCLLLPQGSESQQCIL